MKNLLFKLVTGFKIGCYAFQNPLVFQKGNLKTIADLFSMIMKVATERRPCVSRIAFVNVSDESEELIEGVSIWCGVGAGADPIKRVEELSRTNSQLLEENKLLKHNNENLYPLEVMVELLENYSGARSYLGKAVEDIPKAEYTRDYLKTRPKF